MITIGAEFGAQFYGWSPGRLPPPSSRLPLPPNASTT
jgi:hypothetical protein